MPDGIEDVAVAGQLRRRTAGDSEVGQAVARVVGVVAYDTIWISDRLRMRPARTLVFRDSQIQDLVETAESHLY